MPQITDRHSQYTESSAVWKRCRDSRKGEDAIKLGGEIYLPKLGGQDEAEYAAYKLRARYYTAFGKTIAGHVGLAMRKGVIIEQPESLESISSNIDRKGADIPAYYKTLLSEILEVGRVGTLVDYTKVQANATLAETQSARPYWIQYKTEDILDWEYADGVLTYVALRERIPHRERKVNTDIEWRYRFCEILNGVYTQTIVVGETSEEVIPRMGGKPLPYIPFIIHEPDYDHTVSPPPLLDLVNLALSHYRLKADHSHALHYAALPTPWITGVDANDENAPRTIGPQKIWTITNPDAKVGMLEFTGAGVDSIDKELNNMEDQMAILGSRVLLPEVSENTATASKLRSISETSDLASIVVILEKQLNQLLEFTALWAATAGETGVIIDTNFLPQDLDAGMITALVGAWQSAAFPYSTLVDNLKKAELIDPETTIEDLLAESEKEEEERMVKAAKAVQLVSEASGNTDDEDNDE